MHDADEIMRHARRRALFAEEELKERLDMGRADIERLIPHRGSFLLLDRIISTDKTAGRAVGSRRLDPADPVFADHFPSDPVYPGVLLVEMMGQLALTLAIMRSGDYSADGTQPSKVRFVRLHDAIFVAPALPGDELTVVSVITDDNGYTFMACGQILRGDSVLAAAVFEAIVLEENEDE